MGIGRLLFILGLFFFTSSSADAAGSLALDTSKDDTFATGVHDAGIGNSYVTAQSFVVPFTGKLTQVDLPIYRSVFSSGSHADLAIDVRTTSEGLPTDDILATISSPSTDFPYSAGFPPVWLPFELGNGGIDVQQGQTLAIVARTLSDATGMGIYAVNMTEEDNYTGGQLYQRFDNSADWHTSAPGDIYLRVSGN